MVKTIFVKKLISDDDIEDLLSFHVGSDYFETVIKEDVDVIIEETGEYLLRFRKKVIDESLCKQAYDNLLKFARRRTTLRGMASGTQGKKTAKTNNPVRSNIIGYFDKNSPFNKLIYKRAGVPQPKCRETSFTGNQKAQWELVIPYLKEIDRNYKELFPIEHERQRIACQSTKFKIEDTAFSTITINLNYQTSIHTDKGDYKGGFGNLCVIEEGEYQGGFTGFPQYGVAVDVRSGDFLGMNVHIPHCNTPIIGEGNRMSFVSYLRQGIVDKCKNEEIFTTEMFNDLKELPYVKKKKGEFYK